jgi:class 3 adenylate cyclase
MNDVKLTRRLTMIIVLDVVGYGRLMGRDEEGTHLRLAALRTEVLGPAIERRGGAFIKDTGDGLLAEFSSVLCCAGLVVGEEIRLARIDEPHQGGAGDGLIPVAE